MSRAHQFAGDAYGDRADFAHPLQVSRIVQAAGGSDVLVATAVLHDLLEDTDVRAEQIGAAFGPHIEALVCTLTEDASIRGYAARKADLRARACADGRDTSLIFVADKLASVRAMRHGTKEIKPRKLAHYRATVELMRSQRPDLPLLDELATELAALESDRQISV